MKFVDIKNDIAFRKIYGNENKKEILISFINAVLGFTGDRKIVTVTFLNPFQLPDLLKYKTTVIDVKATYLTKHIICNSETKEQILKDFEYNFIELLKFNLEIKTCENLLDKWIYFIKNAENLEVIPDGIDDKGLSEAYHDADQMTWTKKELELYDYAKMRERDEIEEREKAYQNGVQNGVEIGAENEKIEIAKQMIFDNEPIEKIIKYTKLNREPIEKLINGMKTATNIL